MKQLSIDKENLIIALKQAAHTSWVSKLENRVDPRKNREIYRLLKMNEDKKRVYLLRRVKYFKKSTAIHKSRIKAHKSFTKAMHRKKRLYFLNVKNTDDIHLVEDEFARYVKKPNYASRVKIAQTLFAKKIRRLQLKSIEDTHNQGRFKWAGKVKTLFSHLNPTNKLKRKWSNYLTHIHMLPLKRPFRFDHSIVLNYRLTAKLMTYYFNKRDNAYDVYYDVGTHERVQASTKDFWWVDEKFLYNNLPFNRKWSVVLYNTYKTPNQLKVSPIDTFSSDTNGLNLEQYVSGSWQLDPIYDLYRIRKDFFRPVKGTIYQLDKITGYFGPNSNMYWLTAPHMFKTFFMSSFFKSKEIENPYRFFKTLNDECTNNVNKIQQVTVKFNKAVFSHNNKLINSIKIYMYIRLLTAISTIRPIMHKYKITLSSKIVGKIFKPRFGKAKIPSVLYNKLSYITNFLTFKVDMPIVRDDFNWAYLKGRRTLNKKKLVLLSNSITNK